MQDLTDRGWSFNGPDREFMTNPHCRQPLLQLAFCILSMKQSVTSMSTPHYFIKVISSTLLELYILNRLSY
jgi:hypothetical protein